MIDVTIFRMTAGLIPFATALAFTLLIALPCQQMPVAGHIPPTTATGDVVDVRSEMDALEHASSRDRYRCGLSKK